MDTLEGGIDHNCYFEGVVGTGPQPADIMFIGIAPGRHEATRSRRPFTGPSGQLLDALLKFIGLQRADVYTTNLICWWNDKPSYDEIQQCWGRLCDEIRAVKPKIMVVLGTIAWNILSQASGIDVKFGKAHRGLFYSELFDCWMLCTYHPAAYLHDAKAAKLDITDGVRDFRKIPLYLSAPRNFGSVSYDVAQGARDAQDYLEHLRSSHSPGDIVSCDVETKYDGTAMVSIAFACSGSDCAKAGRGFHIPRDLMSSVDWALLNDTAVRWTFHNGMFDQGQIKKHLNVYLPIREDTMLMSYSLDERSGSDKESDSSGTARSVGVHGLKLLAMEYCGAERYADSGVKPEDMTPQQLAEYNSKDAIYTLRLQQYFEPLQRADNVREMYETMLIRGANTMAEIRDYGIYIDYGALCDLANEWLPEWIRVEEELQEDAKALGWPADEINTQSWQQLGKLIYDICGHAEVGKSKRSTKQDVLKVIAEEPTPLGAFCAKLLEWRHLEHDMGVYVTGVDEARDNYSRIHPEPLLHGTRNSRLAYHDPPVQTIPKPRTVGMARARIRRMFAAPKDFVLMEADNRQSELWTAYMNSGDKNMLEDLLSGDFHARGAQGAFNVVKTELDPLDWELLRDSFKIIVYGSFYGAGPAALAGDKGIQGRGSTGNYRLLDTQEDARKALAAFAARYSDYWAWREREKQKVIREGEQQSACGHKRRYYLVQSYSQLNQAINFPVSCLSHSFLFMGLLELHEALRGMRSHILLEVHDSILLEVHKDEVRQVAQLAEEIMSKPRFGFDVGIPVDIKVGINWLDLVKLEEYLENSRVA